MTLRPGTVFRHARLLDVEWTPGPGERYADAPRALCIVTATRGGRIYYRQGTERGKGTAHFRADDAARHVAAIIRP